MILPEDIKYLIQFHGEPGVGGLINLQEFIKKPTKKEYPTYLSILLEVVLSRHQAGISLEVDGLGRYAFITIPDELIENMSIHQ